MKKNLILSLCVLVGLAACQKENKGVTSAPKLKLTAKHDASLPPAYTDMTLMSDGSYEAVWNGCSIKVTGTPAWDQVKYPTLINGVPVQAVTLSTYDPSNWINYANSGQDGNVFQVSQIQISLVTANADGFNSDLGTYWNALDTWIGAGQQGTAPAIGTYVKDSYTATVGGNQINLYTGKLIRVTTGSHVAIADMSYPLPTATAPPPTSFTVQITDPLNSQTTYFLNGTNGLLIKADKGTNSNYTNGVYVPISGNYTKTTGTSIYHYWGTIIRTDGSSFNFDITQDLS